MTLFIRATVTVPHDSGLPEDAIVNTWAFTAADATLIGGAAIAWNLAMNTFYGALVGSLSAAHNWDAGVTEYIDMTENQPRIPFYTGVLDLPALTGSLADMPAEVAVCMSFKGATASGQNQRRRRGRVYIGPLRQADTQHNVVPTTLADTIATAGAALRDTALVDWCVYSRYTHHAVPVGRDINEKDEDGDAVFPEVSDALPSSFIPVTTVWVDNAWDIQRRRGLKATYRKTL